MKNDGYSNEKVNAVLEYVLRLAFTEADFADLAVAVADQAGVQKRDQRLIEDLVKGAL